MSLKEEIDVQFSDLEVCSGKRGLLCCVAKTMEDISRERKEKGVKEGKIKGRRGEGGRVGGKEEGKKEKCTIVVPSVG